MTPKRAWTESHGYFKFKTVELTKRERNDKGKEDDEVGAGEKASAFISLFQIGLRLCEYLITAM